eukprot:CAMPEP_0183737438 /NCGR_PEP_ID=MMETSP0737-20130205/51968_1 /TAXON_ID=385413 /ORGANISM="Thalassiosira miniscula, Strain CCMP1093" /LENGTH=35 /DNA_ID= /DNA_START= /DNA_END= /DNA_ORIENTATION=
MIIEIAVRISSSGDGDVLSSPKPSLSEEEEVEKCA